MTARLAADRAPAPSPPTGSVVAIVARLGHVDARGDVLLPGAIRDGTRVYISRWDHSAARQGRAPVGEGRLRVEGDRVVLRGRFFPTEAAREARAFLREASDVVWEALVRPVRVAPLTAPWRARGAERLIAEAEVREVSPVLMGALAEARTLELRNAGFAPTYDEIGYSTKRLADDFGRWSAKWAAHERQDHEVAQPLDLRAAAARVEELGRELEEWENRDRENRERARQLRAENLSRPGTVAATLQRMADELAHRWFGRIPGPAVMHHAEWDRSYVRGERRPPTVKGWYYVAEGDVVHVVAGGTLAQALETLCHELIHWGGQRDEATAEAAGRAIATMYRLGHRHNWEAWA